MRTKYIISNDLGHSDYTDFYELAVVMATKMAKIHNAPATIRTGKGWAELVATFEPAN